MINRLDLTKLKGAHRAALPDFVSPQLATLVKEAPPGDEWLHELKFDGYRMLCRIGHGKVRFWSRNRVEWTAKFPSIARAMQSIAATSAIFDGEVVVMDSRGRTSFQRLQQAMGKGGSAEFIYEVFDLVYLDGFNLAKTPLIERKRLLKKLLGATDASGPLRYSDHIEGSGAEVFKQACRKGTEGIVSKLATSTYDSARNRNWQKVKCSKQQEFVIAGYTPSKKGLPGFGSLILGVYEEGELVYTGRVGTGFSLKKRVELKKKFDTIARETAAFAVKPKAAGLADAHWVSPRLVAEVTFTEWTSDGAIRHPSFQGLREDKKPHEVHREIA
ncbi:MAG TPA: non-homologous end-joining DNA ligase [Blastocatellia bacterium]|nr:non-homologous end-joining DNA ligase [Blastocatellia bacterium]